MFSRRSLLALTATIPVTQQLFRLDMKDTVLAPLDTGDIEIIGISPDAATLVGLTRDDTLCFLDAESLEVKSESQSVPEIGALDRLSPAWSPDNSKLAFSLDAWRLLRDSDIFVVDVATAEVTNVTAEGHDREAESIMEMPDVMMDMYPVWTGDDELLFARHDMQTENQPAVSIQTMNLSSGEPELLHDLSANGIYYVIHPIHLLQDGTMTFTSQGQDPADIAITMLTPNGEVPRVKHEDLPHVMQIDANDTHSVVIATGPELEELWMVPHNATQAPVLFAEAIGYEDELFVGSPAIASNPETLVGVMHSSSSDKFRVLTNIDGDRKDRGYLDGEVATPTCHLAGDTLLITTRENAWQIDLKV